jgi:hypothetical protein
MMRRGRHLGCSDATGTIEGGKHLGQADHFSPDGCILVYDRHLKPLIRQIQGRLQARDAAADNQCIKF